MTRRPMLILNGKATRYRDLRISLHSNNLITHEFTEIDWHYYEGARVSYSTRPSGRRVIWVSTEVPDEMD